MSRDIEVKEQVIESVAEAEVLRHGDGCLLLVDGKPFRIDAQTAIRLAWDLCVMFQDSRPQGSESAEFLA